MSRRIIRALIAAIAVFILVFSVSSGSLPQIPKQVILSDPSPTHIAQAVLASYGILAPGDPSAPSTQTQEVQPTATTTRVRSVIDGDTIVLENGDKVRFIGMDTPEEHPTTGGGPQCFANEATARTTALLSPGIVTLESDTADKDRYGRLLRYVILPDGQMLNEILVREGYARALSIAPDTRHKDLFAAAEQEARTAGRGLWGPPCNGK